MRTLSFLLILASGMAWAEGASSPVLVGPFACLHALDWAAPGGAFQAPLLENKEYDKTTLVLPADRNGRPGVYIYNSHTVKFYPYPDSDSEPHKLAVKIDGQDLPVMLEVSKTETLTTITEKKLNPDLDWNAGEEALEYETVQRLVDEIPSRATQLAERFKSRMVQARIETPDHPNPNVILNYQDGEPVIRHFQDALEACQNRQIPLPQEALQSFEETKRRAMAWGSQADYRQVHAPTSDRETALQTP